MTNRKGRPCFEATISSKLPETNGLAFISCPAITGTAAQTSARKAISEHLLAIVKYKRFISFVIRNHPRKTGLNRRAAVEPTSKGISRHSIPLNGFWSMNVLSIDSDVAFENTKQ